MQSPTHAPSEQTYGQEAVSCHAPSLLHACKFIGVPASPAMPHSMAPGAHTPEHPVSEQTVVQGTPGSQSPVALQVDVIPSTHFLLPGEQMPVHAPLVQRNGQTDSCCHVPAALQTRSSSPRQSSAPGMQAVPPSPLIDASVPAPPSFCAAGGGMS